MRFDVDVLDFYDDILAVFDLATVLATFSKSWEFFSSTFWSLWSELRKTKK
jgi:hypothetical protein